MYDHTKTTPRTASSVTNSASSGPIGYFQILSLTLSSNSSLAKVTPSECDPKKEKRAKKSTLRQPELTLSSLVNHLHLSLEFQITRLLLYVVWLQVQSSYIYSFCNSKMIIVY